MQKMQQVFPKTLLRVRGTDSVRQQERLFVDGNSGERCRNHSRNATTKSNTRGTKTSLRSQTLWGPIGEDTKRHTRRDSQDTQRRYPHRPPDEVELYCNLHNAGCKRVAALGCSEHTRRTCLCPSQRPTPADWATTSPTVPTRHHHRCINHGGDGAGQGCSRRCAARRVRRLQGSADTSQDSPPVVPDSCGVLQLVGNAHGEIFPGREASAGRTTGRLSGTSKGGQSNKGACAIFRRTGRRDAAAMKASAAARLSPSPRGCVPCRPGR